MNKRFENGMFSVLGYIVAFFRLVLIGFMAVSWVVLGIATVYLVIHLGIWLVAHLSKYAFYVLGVVLALWALGAFVDYMRNNDPYEGGREG